MTVNKQDISKLKNKLNFINSYNFKDTDKIYKKENVEDLARNINELKGKNKSLSETGLKAINYKHGSGALEAASEILSSI